MKYLHHFLTEQEFNSVYNGHYLEPWISLTDNKGVNYNKTEAEFLCTEFTIEALGSGEIDWALGNLQVKYSKNGETWTTATGSVVIPVVQGDIVQFKGNNSSYADHPLTSTVSCNVSGNIMSLVNETNFATATSVPQEAFKRLFSDEYNYTSLQIVSADKLFLPATVLADSCYQSMFSDCALLVKAPKLPATTLAPSCYYGMFSRCTSLTKAPELPATTLSSQCYSNMFTECSALTTAPRLPATTLTQYCYESMFFFCESLTTAPELQATTLANNCYYNMFANCTSLDTVQETLPAQTLANSCYFSMFSGCINLTTAPILPATTLVSNCYKEMFYGCSKLNYIKAMFTTTPGTSYTSNWVRSVSSSGTFVKNANAAWTTTGNNAVPSKWTVQTASA